MSDTREIVIQAQKDVIESHGLCDWFEKYSWLTGFIGDIHAPVWFLAENPSLSQIDKQAMKYDLNENLQWNASAGDHLLREAITEAGLKAGDPKEDEGWKCYISNVDKEPEKVKERGEKVKKDSNYLRQRAQIWRPVLQKQVDLGLPNIIVILGNNADDILKHMNLRIPESTKITKIYHYTYIMNRQERGGKRRPRGHPERIKEYKERIADIAKRCA